MDGSDTVMFVVAAAMEECGGGDKEVVMNCRGVQMVIREVMITVTVRRRVVWPCRWRVDRLRE